MQFSVRKNVLYTSVSHLGKTVETNPVNPILSNFLIQIEELNIKITASDTQMKEIVTVPLHEKCTTECLFLVDAKRIVDCLKVLPDEVLTFEVEESGYLDIIWSNGETVIPIDMSVMDYPEYDKYADNYKGTYTVPFGQLTKALKNVLFAVDPENLNVVITGVCFSLTEKETVLVGTDARKLACCSLQEGMGFGDCIFVLPYKPAKEFSEIAAASDEQVQIEYYVRYVKITVGSYVIVSRLVDGTFPSFKSIIPEKKNNPLSFDKKRLLETIERVGICGDIDKNAICFEFGKEKLLVEGRDVIKGSYAKESLQCAYNGPELKIGFQLKNLREILKNFPEDRFDMCFTAPDKVVMLCQEGEQIGNVRYVIMPTLTEPVE